MCASVSLRKISRSTGSIPVSATGGSTASASATAAGGGCAIATAAGSGGWLPSRPESASARDIRLARSCPVSPPCSSSSMSCGIAWTASRVIATISGERASVSLITLLSRLSMHHENSPTRAAPTMRPLPLRVWNMRRRSRSESMSCGSCSQRGNSSSRCAAFSRASSTNSATNSGSPAVETVTAGGAAGVSAAVGTGSAAASCPAPPGPCKGTTLRSAAARLPRDASAASSSSCDSGWPACSSSM